MEKINGEVGRTITSMSLNPQTENALLLAFENSQILSSEFYPESPGDNLHFTHLSQNFHCGTVTGIDICIRK
jgi:hypothetical protein